MLKSCIKCNKASANLLQVPEFLQMMQQCTTTSNFFSEVLQNVQQCCFIQAVGERRRSKLVKDGRSTARLVRVILSASRINSGAGRMIVYKRSVRLCVRIFTAKGNEKIWTQQRWEQRSVCGASTQALTLILLQNKGCPK
ncbi:hypothetical protein BK146_11010 [Paenibacillus sp. FSL R7-0333]|nr:hypothetical protein BK146_11010 [Paenibacillus sp. FSL R7-0333]